MPRAFLITNRRYKSETQPEDEVDNLVYKHGDILCVRTSELSYSTLVNSCHDQHDMQREISSALTRYDDADTLSCDSRGLTPSPPCAMDLLATAAVVDAEENGFTIHMQQKKTHGSLKSLDRNLKDLVEKAWNEINEGENYICPDCGKCYSTSSNLARHRQTHRSVSDKKARKCPHCDKVYVSMPAYSMHVRTHNQGCECSFCGKRFSRPWLLQGHIRTHTGEKPFKCPTCDKAFADKSNLRAHVQTHSSEKPYECQRCGKTFALKSYLYKHEESSCMRGQRNHKR